MFSLLVLTLVSGLIFSAVGEPLVLNENGVTRGELGPWEECPSGTYATGFQLKVEYDKLAFDDTAVNGIRLICSRIGENAFEKQTPSSAVAPNGNWRSRKYCDLGTVIGFQVRNLTYSSGPGFDNMGVTNLKVYCGGVSMRKYWLEGDGLNKYGAYGPEQICEPGQAIKAIRTRVDKAVSDRDRYLAAGLWNVEMRCHDIPVLERDCKPKTRYELLLECNNLNGKTELLCEYMSKEGVGLSKVQKESVIHSNQVKSTLGISVEAGVPFVRSIFEHDKTWVSETGSVDSAASAQVWNKETMSMVSLPVANGTIVRIFKVFGTCGPFDVSYTSIEKTELDVSEIPNPIPSKGFVCEMPADGVYRNKTLNRTQ